MPAHESAPSAAAMPQSGYDDAPRYAAQALEAYAVALLEAAGAAAEIARDTASVLLDGDLMGHTTHGLALLPGYLQALGDGSMRSEGSPTTLASAPATAVSTSASSAASASASASGSAKLPKFPPGKNPVASATASATAEPSASSPDTFGSTGLTKDY